jgi:DNA-dependent RNA polymerase
MMKRIFLKLCYRLYDLVYQYTGVKFTLLNIFNFNTIIFLIFICYKYLKGIDIYFLISFFISCLLSFFVLDGFKSSDNIFINYFKLFIKNFLVLNIVVCLYFGLGVYFDLLPVIECSTVDNSMNMDNSENNNKSIKEKDVINIKSGSDGDGKEYYKFKFDKDKVDNVLKSSGEIAKNIGNNIAPNIGAGAAAGTVGAAVIKATSAMPPAQRMGLIFGSTAVAAAGTKVGLSVGGSALKNLDILGGIKKSKHADPDIDTIPSPDDIMINSALEYGDLKSPLEMILEGQLTLNILLLILVIFLIYILLNIFVFSQNINIINNYIIKYLPIKYKDVYNKYVDKGKEYNTRVMVVMFIINSIILILFILMNILISYELNNNIDDYVIVYNHIHENEKLLLILTTIKAIKNKYKNNNYIGSRLYSSINVENNKINIKESNDLDFLINLDINQKIEIFGSYENYLKKLSDINEINENFMTEYYPNLKDDELFNVLIKSLNPIVRNKVNFVLDLFENINKLNNIKNKIISFSEILEKKLLLELISDLNNIRKELIKILQELGLNDRDLYKILSNINKNIKNNIISGSSAKFYDIIKDLSEEDEFKKIWEGLNEIIYKDLFKADVNDEDICGLSFEDENRKNNYISEMKELFVKIYYLMKLCKDNKIKGFESILEWFKGYKNEIIIYSKIDKIERYNIKKKREERKKRMRDGLIIQGYRNILTQSINKLNFIIHEFITNKDKSLDKVFKDKTNIVEDISNIENIIKNDFLNLISNVERVLNIENFILDLSRNLDDTHLNDQYDKIMDFLSELFDRTKLSHDELINIIEIISNYNLDYIRTSENILNKETSLSMNSYLYVKCREIINNTNIPAENRQLLLEQFILSYEKEFTLNIIKNMKNKVSDYKLLTRIYKHSTPQFVKRINNFVENNKKRNYELYLKNKNDMSKFGNNLALALFISIDNNQLTNIIFSKVVRLVGLSGGIKQNEFLGHISDEMLLILKYNLKNKDIINKLSDEDKIIISEIENRLINLPLESKYQFGDLLIEFILDEFNYIFSKENIYENNEHHIYITIKSEYLSILTGSIFNPIKLPMVAQPKKWDFSNECSSDGTTTVTQMGGYYLDEFNELSKNNTIIRQNSFNKFNSSLSKIQFNTINFLNSKPFEINIDILNIIVEEWNEKEKSILFKEFNQLHPKTNELNKLNSEFKKEVFSHNSKYWTYSNIINIALLMKDQIIYFPTFLDFRGRIYPTPNYLSYQSSDLARSLLLFKDINRKSKTENNLKLYNKIVYEILNEDLYNKDKNKNKNVDLMDIDYLKLYLANVYGKNKLSRKGRINWVDKNIKNMIELYENQIDLFKTTYVKDSKEPFQFLACFICYYNFIKYNKEIKIPILFDATCSGIQHLSALTKDTKIAKLVNLISNNEPSDFYQYCIDQIKLYLKDLPNNDLYKDKLLNLDINRKWLKQSIMTIPYNVTDIGISDKLIENFYKLYLDKNEINKLKNGVISLTEIIEIKNNNNNNINNNKIQDKNEKGEYIYIPKVDILLNKDLVILYFSKSEILKFSHIIKYTVLNIIPPFTQLKSYFDKVIEIMKKMDLPIFWQTPSGMKISMNNLQMKTKKIKTSLIKKAKPISILIPTEQIDYNQIKTGLMPNFIHSLDASNIHLLVKNINDLNLNNLNLYTIHDCFASDYKNIRIIELLVKHSFVQLYFKKNYLETVHNSFLNQIASYTDIFEESINNENIKYIIIPTTTKKGKTKNIIKQEKLILPNLPDYNWEINKDKIKNEILFNSYFIS